MTYDDFDLIVERAGERLRARVLGSPGGAASVEFSLPFSADRLENYLLRLGRTSRLTRRVESSAIRTAREFGGELFAAVISGDVRASFDRSFKAARQQGRGLRLRLQLAAPELADLPWEFLYDKQTRRFPALSVRTPLVRFIELADRLQPLGLTPPIRALVMIASPTDYPQLDVEAEWGKLTSALRDLVEAGHVAIDRLDNATLNALQRQLRRSQYHIFHFIGHGEFDHGSQEGVLILEAEDGRGERVSSQYLGLLLHDHESLRLAILNACEGARTSRTDPFAGSAQTLVLHGIPAVIAMQFEIADDVAATFAHEFYGAAADGYPIDAAVTEARKAIFASGRDVEWATPVLYLRTPDARIFDVHKPASRPAAPVAKTVEQPADSALTRAATLARSAGVALAHGKHEEALRALVEVSALDPAHPELSELMDIAEQQRAVAETRSRLRLEVQRHLDAARDLCARGDLTGAEKRLEDALALKPGDRQARRVADMVTQQRRAAQSSSTPRDVSATPAAAPAAEDIAARVREPERDPSAAPERPPAPEHERDLLE